MPDIGPAHMLTLSNTPQSVTYTFNQPWVKKIGVKDLKVFVSGNNLWLWTRMPDDRESNFSSSGGASGAYPTMKRINFGIKFNL